MAKISVLNTEITVLNYNDNDYISLTDMASAKEGDSRAADIIKNWIRNRYTIEFNPRLRYGQTAFSYLPRDGH